MTVKTPDTELKLQQNLDARNKEVEKAFYLISQSVKTLLTTFEAIKYRTCIEINHSKSGRETTLISELVCFFFNLTLAVNRVGYKMIYFAYDEDALARFGPRLFNRVLRMVFKHTMFESTKLNIEDCVRINSEVKEIQNFFINRLANGGNDFISIEVVEKIKN